MKRQEWYDSVQFKKLRLLNNWTHEIKQMTQKLYDILEIVLEDKPDSVIGDKFTIAERQLRIVDVEAVRLIDAMSKFTVTLEPREFEDWLPWADPLKPKDKPKENTDGKDTR